MNASTRLVLASLLACPLLSACDSAREEPKASVEERVARFERPHDKKAVRRVGGGTDVPTIVDASKQGGDGDEGNAEISFDPPYDGEPVNTEKLANGLVAEDFVVGDGAEATEGAKVTVHYTGYLKDGTVFDSSVKKKRPFSFDVGGGRVIKGWDEGVAGMKVGGKRRLQVPSELGYKDRRMGAIPPNSDLVFTIELLNVRPPLPDPQPASAFEGQPRSKQTLEGGLIVETYKEGEGDGAKKGDTVSVHYTGTLADGTEFDSSVNKKRPPIEFPLGQRRVIEGWDKGLEGMKVGELRKLSIPPELGYGDKEKPNIPANSILVFTVEMMAITPKPE